MSESAARKMLPHYHLHGLGLAEASGKAKGRLTCNLTATASRDASLIPLNTEWVKQEAIRRYKDIKHPTLIDICTMIVAMQARYGNTNVPVYKEDVRGYYTLCRFASWATRLMAFAIHGTDKEVEGAIYFSAKGNFGWT